MVTVGTSRPGRHPLYRLPSPQSAAADAVMTEMHFFISRAENFIVVAVNQPYGQFE